MPVQMIELEEVAMGVSDEALEALSSPLKYLPSSTAPNSTCEGDVADGCPW